MTDTRAKIIALLPALSEMFPDMRLGQLMLNLAYWSRGFSMESIYDVEDDELLAMILEKLDRCDEIHRPHDDAADPP